MGDNHLQQRHAEIQPHLRPFYQPNPNSVLTNGADGSAADEEEYTIRCICGYSHDDGNTVYCEQCETWQHIDCYYYPDHSVPQVHQCVHCYPHPKLDAHGASQRQRARLQDELPARESKKRPRNHKKAKAKDHYLQQNGYTPSNEQGPDRNNGSLWDHQPPPAKRAKTNHKHSNSISNNLHAMQRPSSSSGLAGQAPAKRPLTELPHDYFSEDFIKVHQNDTDFTPVNANLHGSIDFTNQLSRWLDDEEEFKAVTGGLTHSQVLQQAPSLEELEVPIQKRMQTDDSVVFHGAHPTWPYLTVEKDLVKGQLVAELRGLLGHRDEYKADPDNRWDYLRHPDHFVFFHPYLPIYIDCRSEGTNLRYVRRSCRPNLEMKTFITDARDIRFCFNAIDDIPSGTEITIAWDVKHDPTLHECLQRHNLAQEKEYVSKWMETILSHFGGCACQLAPPFCFMEHWDRRLSHTAVIPETNSNHTKMNKKRKQQRKSPQNAGRASNSRAGSEANENDEEDEDDTRSSSRSSKPSRDATPTQSESLREQKKLEQAMRRIEKQESEGQPGTKKKKRISGNSVNTSVGRPSANSATTPKNSNSPMPSGRPRNAHKVNGDISAGSRPSPSIQSQSGATSPGNQSRPRALPNGIHREAVRPEYVDRSTQTEEEPELPEPTLTPATERKPYMSLSKRLLKRSYLRRLQQAKSAENENAVEAPPSPSVSVSVPEPVEDVSNAHDRPDSNPKGFVKTDGDVEMKDLESQGPDVEMVDTNAAVVDDSEGSATAHPLITSPPALTVSTEQAPQYAESQSAPAWYGGLGVASHKDPRPLKGVGLRIDMPPPSFPRSSLSNGNMDSSPSTRSAPILQSPPVASPPLATSTSTPGGTSITNQSPYKKRMSLSDYINKKKQTPVTEKSQALSLQTAMGDATMSDTTASPTKTDLESAVKSVSPPVEQVKSEDS